MTTIRCTCSNEQLAYVECICDAQVNVATDELNRRFDEENARNEEAFERFWEQQEQAEAAHRAAEDAYWAEQQRQHLGIGA